jgi:acyl carrier protein
MGLDTVELIMRVEEHFGIEISNAEAAKLETVGLLHGYIVGELSQVGRFNGDRDAVYAQLRELICNQLGIEPEEVVPSARFVDDLGAD